MKWTNPFWYLQTLLHLYTTLWVNAPFKLFGENRLTMAWWDLWMPNIAYIVFGNYEWSQGKKWNAIRGIHSIR